MRSYYTTTFDGLTIRVVKAQADSSEDIQISVMADRFDSSSPRKLLSAFGDSYLEANGWSKIAVVNGGIFNSQYAPIIYANGIEKAYWTVNEDDDATLNNVMGLGHTGTDSNSPIIEVQSTIRNNWAGYRGAVIGAFGLLRNGSVDQGSTSLQGEYGLKSGRSIVGKDSSGAIYFISFPGTTGSTGLTGARTLALAQALGLSDAVCMDGGGSVGLIYLGEWKVSSSRLIKNAIAIYAKSKGSGPGPDPGPPPGVITDINKMDQYTPIYEHSWPHMTKVNGVLVPIVDIKIKRNGELVSLNDIRKGGN